MAPRKWTVNFLQNDQNGLVVGDEAAHRAAAALGDRADQPTIAALSEMLSLLERVGGQFYVTAFRERVEGDEDFSTAGLVFRYETRDSSVEFFKPPQSIGDIPITDSAAPPTRVAVEPPPEILLEEEPDPELLPEDEPEPVAEDRDPEPALTD